MQKKLSLTLSHLAVFILGIAFGLYFLSYAYQTYVMQKLFADEHAQTPVSEDEVAEIPATSTTESAWNGLWAVYTSPQGVSFRYPKQIGVIDRCGDQKEQNPYVSTKIIEDSKHGIVYVAPEYYFDYPATADGSQDTTKPCQKIYYSLDQIDGEDLAQTEYFSSGNILGGLNINIRAVKDQNELDKFIKDIYGSGCKIKAQEVYQDAEGNVTSLDEMGGNNEIELNAGEDAEGNVTSLGETVCPVNYGYKILHGTATNKSVAMSLGQDCTIDNGASPENPTGYECYITEIADSVRID